MTLPQKGQVVVAVSRGVGRYAEVPYGAEATLVLMKIENSPDRCQRGNCDMPGW